MTISYNKIHAQDQVTSYMWKFLLLVCLLSHGWLQGFNIAEIILKFLEIPQARLPVSYHIMQAILNQQQQHCDTTRSEVITK